MSLIINPGVTINPGVSLTAIRPPTGLTSGDASTSAWQIKQDYPASTDGLYWIKNDNIAGGTPVQIYADMTTDGGGWTLILQNTVPTWNFANALERNQFSPPSTLETAFSSNDSANYSIIGWADYIKRSASGFDYMLEAGARNSNGGIWTANQAYSFVDVADRSAIAAQGVGVYFGGPSQDLYTGTQGFHQDITEKVKFGSWNYENNGLEHRMPWFLGQQDGLSGEAIFTTSNADGGSWWGSLMTFTASFQPAPWIQELQNPGIIWYWVR